MLILNFRVFLDMKINTLKLTWSDLSGTQNVTKSALKWLADKQSLTLVLKQKFDDFSVNVVSQTQAMPHPHECEKLKFEKPALIREVELLGSGQVLVFARSIIPITADTQHLADIGSAPLGEILFNDIAVKRGELQITQLGDIWGRRSVFTIGTTPLLVSEFFLPCLYA